MWLCYSRRRNRDLVPFLDAQTDHAVELATIPRYQHAIICWRDAGDEQIISADRRDSFSSSFLEVDRITPLATPLRDRCATPGALENNRRREPLPSKRRGPPGTSTH